MDGKVGTITTQMRLWSWLSAYYMYAQKYAGIIDSGLHHKYSQWSGDL